MKHAKQNLDLDNCFHISFLNNNIRQLFELYMNG